MEIPTGKTCADATDDRCSITTSRSTTVMNEFSFNIGGGLGKKRWDLKGRGGSPGVLKAAFDFGATWTYRESVTNTTTETDTKPTIAAGLCGYWTFVPIYVT